MISPSALTSHLSQSLCYKLMANQEFWTSGFWKIHVKLVVVKKSIKLIACLSSLRLSLLSPGFLLFKDFCMNEIDEAVPQLKFYEEVSVPSVSLQDCLWKDNSPGP